MMRRPSSLRARMTAAVTVLFAAWVALACTALFAYSYRAADRRAQRRLSEAAQELAGDLREEPAASDPSRGPAQRIIGILEREPVDEPSQHDLSLLVVGPRDRIVWRSGRVAPPWPPTRDTDWRVTTVPAGDYTVAVGLDWGRTESALREQALALLCLGLLTVGAAALGAWVLVGRTLSPIGLLSRHAREASVDDLRVQLVAPSDDAEISELVATLNGLLGRLAQEAAAKGRFYAAASHELRTPLQALSGHLEVALARPRTGEEYRAAIHEGLEQTRRLTRLAQDLLLLNQLESAPSTEMGEPVALAEVCARALWQVKPTVVQRGLRLSVEAVADTTLVASPTHTDILVRNLVENAVRYAAPGGEVRLSTQESGEGVVLTVFNECPPIPGWDATSLFEAFARTDRSRNTATGGHGLGLAICGAIARANQWELSLHHNGSGVLGAVVFPRRGLREEGP